MNPQRFFLHKQVVSKPTWRRIDIYIFNLVVEWRCCYRRLVGEAAIRQTSLHIHISNKSTSKRRISSLTDDDDDDNNNKNNNNNNNKDIHIGDTLPISPQHDKSDLELDGILPLLELPQHHSHRRHERKQLQR